MRRLLSLLLLAALIGVPASSHAIRVGQEAPDFLLADVFTEEPIALSDHRGKVVVLVFFAPW